MEVIPSVGVQDTHIHSPQLWTGKIITGAPKEHLSSFVGGKRSAAKICI